MHFEDELRQNLVSADPSACENFESIFMKTFEANAPTKTKMVRANNKSHVNKELRRAITRRSTYCRAKTKKNINMFQMIHYS